MKKVYVLYDSSVCEPIRVFCDMEVAMVAALNRLTIFSHICVGFSADEEEAVIEYRHHGTGKLYALTVQACDLDEKEA